MHAALNADRIILRKLILGQLILLLCPLIAYGYTSHIIVRYFSEAIHSNYYTWTKQQMDDMPNQPETMCQVNKELSQ